MAELAYLADAMNSPQNPAERARAPVTPAQIRSVQFHPSPVAWRGYPPTEVRDLLDRAAVSLQLAQDECLGLEAEIDRLRNFYRNRSGSLAAAQAGSEGPGLIGTLHRYADTQAQHAADYADGLGDRTAAPERVLQHARVRTAIVVRTAAGGGDDADAERARSWVGHFSHAMRTQAAAVYDTVAAKVDPAAPGNP